MKLSLLDQALLEEKRLEVQIRSQRLKRKLNFYETLKNLLPSYVPRPKQKLFHQSSAREKGIKGGYGSGKTMAFCAEAITLAFINKPLWIVLSSPSFDNALEAVLPHLKDFCERNGYNYNFIKDSGHFEIMFGENKKDKGNIYLIGQKFYKGPNIAAVGLDEPFSQKKEIFDNLIARVRHPLAKRHQVFWAGTPEPDTMQWGYSYFENEHNSQKLFTITIPTEDNIYLPPEYIQNLKDKYDAKQQEVYLCGKYISLSQGKVYYMFDRSRNVITNGTEKPKEIIISFDFNVDPMCAVEIVIRNQIRIQTDEYIIHSSNTAELCSVIIDRLKRKYRFKGLSLIVTGDASGRSKKTSSFGKSDYMIIKEWFDKSGYDFTITVPEENPPVRDRVNYVNKLFETKRFSITPECMYSIRDRELVGWKNNADGFLIDKSKKDLTHLSDAADYGLWNTRVITDTNNNEQTIYMGRRTIRGADRRGNR